MKKMYLLTYHIKGGGLKTSPLSHILALASSAQMFSKSIDHPLSLQRINLIQIVHLPLDGRKVLDLRNTEVRPIGMPLLEVNEEFLIFFINHGIHDPYQFGSCLK